LWWKFIVWKFADRIHIVKNNMLDIFCEIDGVSISVYHTSGRKLSEGGSRER